MGFPLGLDQSDVERIAAMLTDYEAGRLFQSAPPGVVPRGVPIETYTGLVAETIAASSGEPTSGQVSIFAADGLMMAADSNFAVIAYSLWDVEIAVCQWVHLNREPFSGQYFVVAIPGTYGCDGSGSGSGLWYCLDLPDVGAWYCIDIDETSGSGG